MQLRSLSINSRPVSNIFLFFDRIGNVGIEVLEELETRLLLNIFHRAGRRGRARRGSGRIVGEDETDGLHLVGRKLPKLLMQVARLLSSTFQQCDGTVIGPLALGIVVDFLKLAPVTT